MIKGNRYTDKCPACENYRTVFVEDIGSPPGKEMKLHCSWCGHSFVRSVNRRALA